MPESVMYTELLVKIKRKYFLVSAYVYFFKKKSLSGFAKYRRRITVERLDPGRGLQELPNVE